jgi:hypothetical protein
VGFGFIAGFFVLISMLGSFLLPLTMVFIFLLAIYFTQGAGMSGWQILLGIPILFVFGYGVHAYLGSVMGYDPIQSSYISGLAAWRLSAVGFSMNDQQFSTILGFGLITAIILFAMMGLFVQMRTKR